jgi:hypothetical protein
MAAPASTKIFHLEPPSDLGVDEDQRSRSRGMRA